MPVAFAKYEGLGNDFVVLDAPPGSLTAAQAVALCDRHLGVGADGVLFVSRTAERARMDIVNADGSVPEMCGNGLRCVALHLVRTGAIAEPRFEVETAAGPHACHVLVAGRAGQVEVSMRPARLAPADVPVRAEAPLLEEPFDLDGTVLRVTAVSMGNPHAVTFDDPGARRAALAPRLQRHPRFPQQANVGFARELGPQRIELAVFERGAGWTRACGTGACAAAVAAVETGRAQRHLPIEVQLPGGALAITVAERSDPIHMTGPARHVFNGTIELPSPRY